MAARKLFATLAFLELAISSGKSAAAAQPPLIDAQFSAKPFEAVPEDVARIAAVTKERGAFILRVQTAVCGFARRPGGQLLVRVSGGLEENFRIGRLVVIAGSRQDGRQVTLIQPLGKAEERQWGCAHR